MKRGVIKSAVQRTEEQERAPHEKQIVKRLADTRRC